MKREDRLSFSDEELKMALEICRFHAPSCGRCPQCGQNNWRYSIHVVGKGEGNLLKAQCRNNDCRYQRYWNTHGKFWTIPTGVPSKTMNNDQRGFDVYVEKDEVEPIEDES